MMLKASDIHFEPQEKMMIVRFRVDGVMHEAGRLPKQFYEGIINAIKIEGTCVSMNTSAAQDGAIRYKSKAAPWTCVFPLFPLWMARRSLCVSLSEYVRNPTLMDLGFSDAYRETF